jgi:hypothetical protein
MARSKKPRSLQNRDEPVLQLTSHQRIVAISAILLWGAFCFVLGIVATNVDQYLEQRRGSAAVEEDAAEAPDEPGQRSTATTPKGQKPAGGGQMGEGRVTSPRQGVITSAKPKPPTEETTRTLPQRDSARVAERGVPEVTLPVKVPAPAPEKSAPKATGTETPVGRKTTVSEQKPTPKPEATATKKETTAPVEPIAPMEPKEPAAASPPKPAAESEPAPNTTPAWQPESSTGRPQEETKPAAAAPPPSPPATPDGVGTSAPTGGFGIQVASFGVTNVGKAEEYRKQAAADTGLPARIVTSEDGKHLRVLVGTYATKEAARKACDELRKRKEFADCYVQVLP